MFIGLISLCFAGSVIGGVTGFFIRYNESRLFGILKGIGIGCFSGLIAELIVVFLCFILK